MDAERFWNNTENRGEVYKHLSRCFYLPDENTRARVADLIEALNEIYPETAELINLNKALNDEFKHLKIDFSQLFVGPFKLLAPPYGSVYLESDRRVMGDSTMEAKNRYKEAGLELSGNLKEAPDHIALELEFMYFLVFKEMEAISRADEEAVLTSLNQQISFLRDHLGAWVSRFAAEVENNAMTDFYKILARITKAIVLKDLVEISKNISVKLAPA